LEDKGLEAEKALSQARTGYNNWDGNFARWSGHLQVLHGSAKTANLPSS